jgi:hypothetical protein
MGLCGAWRRLTSRALLLSFSNHVVRLGATCLAAAHTANHNPRVEAGLGPWVPKHSSQNLKLITRCLVMSPGPQKRTCGATGNQTLNPTPTWSLMNVLGECCRHAVDGDREASRPSSREVAAAPPPYPYRHRCRHQLRRHCSCALMGECWGTQVGSTRQVATWPAACCYFAAQLRCSPPLSSEGRSDCWRR